MSISDREYMTRPEVDDRERPSKPRLWVLVVAIVLVALFLLSVLLPLSFAASVDASLFDRGRTRLSVGAGWGSFNDNGYGIIGLGAGYYLFNNLEAGMDGEVWVGSRPQIYEVSPRLTYVLPEMNGWRPYLGGYYRRSMYSHEFSPLNSAGGRAGLLFPLGTNSTFNAGLVYEGYLNCDKAIYDHCSQVYPELGIGFSL
ncbi:MAG: hypothetical protein WC859_05680 [Elusimicrobiota bacterium]|jgi:hypothetical protein